VKKKIKILLITPDPENNISFYRGRQPLIRLSEHYDMEFDVIDYIPSINQVLDKKIDVVMCTVPYTDMDVYFIKECLSKNIKIWVDIDDLVTDISVWNPRAWLEYGTPDVKNTVKSNLEFCIRSATWVTVSTERLKIEWEVLNKNIYVVENAFDNEFLCNPAPIGTKNEVLYRGGESHNQDLWEYHKPILNAMKESNWNAHFVGMNPIYINQELNGSWTPHLSKPNYWKFLENNTAKILIVPLKNIPFNNSKSCIAWIEGTYAGCAILAPDWIEWKKPGVMNYANQVDFEGKLKGMMSGRIDLKKRVSQSREYINNCQTLLKVNETRWALIDKYVTTRKTI